MSPSPSPVDRETAWQLIGTAEGYRRWFPTDRIGVIELGSSIRTTWWWGAAGTTEHRVLALEPGRLVEFDWSTVDGSAVRYSLSGDDAATTVVTIEATYPETPEGRAGQLLDVAPWTFAALNLTSIASGGVDLRQRGPRPDPSAPSID